MITIYQKGTDAVRAVVDPDDQAYQKCGIMREDQVSLTFSVAEFITFSVGDYAVIFGVSYKLNLPAEFTKVAARKFQFTLSMEGPMYDIRDTAYLFLDASNSFTDAQFPLTGRPIDFLNLVIYNLNRMFPGVWSVGQCIDMPAQAMTFDAQNCLEVLSTLASTFQTEYLVEGYTISLYQKQLVSGVTLQYGKGNALSSIQQQNQDTSGSLNYVTRLYAYGSNRNIGSNYRNGAKYLRMAAGLYIEKNTNLYKTVEAVVYFDGQDQTPEIYPNRSGAVTYTVDEFTFTDETIDFDLNDYKIPGVTWQITFNTGQLTGYTFDIHSFDYGSKTFVINSYSDQTVNLPTALLKPAADDAYVLVNITMPLAYVNDAEAALLTAAQNYLNLNCVPKVQFTVQPNPLYFQAQGLELELGKTYELISAEAGIDRQIRLIEFTRNLRRPYVYTSPVLADQIVPQPLIVQILNKIN